MRTRKLTYRTLKAKGACAEQLAEFKRLFGARANITPDLCAEHSAIFNWDWASRFLLGRVAQVRCEAQRAPAWAKYDRACRRAWKKHHKWIVIRLSKYDKACWRAWKEYRAAHPGAETGRSVACASAVAERRKACELAWAEYNNSYAQKRAKYKETWARAWAAAYISDTEGA